MLKSSNVPKLNWLFRWGNNPAEMYGNHHHQRGLNLILMQHYSQI